MGREKYLQALLVGCSSILRCGATGIGQNISTAQRGRIVHGAAPTTYAAASRSGEGSFNVSSADCLCSRSDTKL